MPLTTKEVIERLDEIGDCLSEKSSDADAGHVLAETYMRRAALLVGKLRGELSSEKSGR